MKKEVAVTDYRGYEVFEKGQGIAIKSVRDFDPVHIFECGQCFRWNREADGSYTGVVGGKAVNVSYSDGALFIDNATFRDFAEVWYSYFDLGRDYGLIKDRLAEKDPIMKKAVEFGGGIRLLRQDLWEVLISYIISSNNNIPRIMKIVGAISKMLGEEIFHGGKSFYTFPGTESLKNLAIEHLNDCGGGYRCKYILKTAAMVAEGVVNLERLSLSDAGAARAELVKLPGVGAKVADCVLLYSGTRYDVFPTDVWVKRVMEELYLEKPSSFKEIQGFARDYFGELAGFAQQYLFYYARANKIGNK